MISKIYIFLLALLILLAVGLPWFILTRWRKWWLVPVLTLVMAMVLPQIDNLIKVIWPGQWLINSKLWPFYDLMVIGYTTLIYFLHRRPQWQHWVGALLFGSVISLIWLFVIGNLRNIIAYPGNETKLWIFKASLWLIHSLSLTYLIHHFLIKRQFKAAVLPIAAGAAVVGLNLFIDGTFGEFMFYETLGSYLRDRQGLNIFFMGHGGWEVTAGGWLMGVVGAGSLIASNLVMQKMMAKKRHRRQDNS